MCSDLGRRSGVDRFSSPTANADPFRFQQTQAKSLLRPHEDFYKFNKKLLRASELFKGILTLKNTKNPYFSG